MRYCLKRGFTILWAIFLLGMSLQLIFSGCSVGPYRQAEILLNQKNDKDALRLYLTLINADRKQKRAPDLRALAGAAIAYHNLKMYPKCIPLCQQVLKRKPNHSAALYYLGASLEATGRAKAALKFYSRYKYVSKDDPFYVFLKARMNMVKMKKRRR